MRAFHRCFLQSFGSFGQTVSEKNLKNQPIRNKNRLWWPCLLTDRDKMSNLYRGPSIYASYQVSGISIRSLPMKISYLASFVAWDRSLDIFHKNQLPYICSMYDTGVKVLSMKINYLAPFKHKHKHQKHAHEN